MLLNLWSDEAGAIVSAEIVLVATILVIGMIVGLKTLRDAVVTELADVGQAISQMDQGYTYSAVDGHAAATAGSLFLDEVDYCDDSDGDSDTSTNISRCVRLATPAADDGTNGEAEALPTS